MTLFLNFRSLFVVSLFASLIFSIACKDYIAAIHKKLVPDYLSNKEMMSAADPNAPFVHASWKKWVQSNSHPIRSLNSTKYMDLFFLRNYLANARLVQMGEITHGAAKQNSIRVRLIKYLHEKLGFNVIAFESGFYEAYFSNKELANMSDYEAMKNSIAGRWNTPELLDLVQYIQATQKTENPLFISGFDVRPSTKKILSRPGYFLNILLKVDPELAYEIYIADTNIVTFFKNGEAVKNYITANLYELRQKYDKLIKCITDNKTLLRTYYSEEEYQVAKVNAQSARITIDNLKGGFYYVRDRQMAENVKFLANELYKDEKIIIWTHNEHTFENSEAIKNSDGNQAYSAMMGTLLHDEFGEALYTIGSFSYRGTVNASGPIVDLKVNTPNCLEAILYNSRKKFYFIDFSQEIKEEGNAWLWQNIQQTRFHRTGNYMIYYKPAEQFDGVIFVDTENPPVKL